MQQPQLLKPLPNDQLRAHRLDIAGCDLPPLTLLHPLIDLPGELQEFVFAVPGDLDLLEIIEGAGFLLAGGVDAFDTLDGHADGGVVHHVEAALVDLAAVLVVLDFVLWSKNDNVQS